MKAEDLLEFCIAQLEKWMGKRPGHRNAQKDLSGSGALPLSMLLALELDRMSSHSPKTLETPAPAPSPAPALVPSAALPPTPPSTSALACNQAGACAPTSFPSPAPSPAPALASTSTAACARAPAPARSPAPPSDCSPSLPLTRMPSLPLPPLPTTFASPTGNSMSMSHLSAATAERLHVSPAHFVSPALAPALRHLVIPNCSNMPTQEHSGSSMSWQANNNDVNVA
jgi:hypothetical protein